MKHRMARKWLGVAAAARGRGHISRNVVCQDEVFYAYGNDVSVIALADGAGSAVNSQLGAEKAASVIANMLIESFEDIYGNPSSGNVARDIMKNIRAGLQQLADEYGVELKTLASTLLAVAVREDKYIYLHLGDGVIGAFRKGRTFMASAPANGEFANSTVFTTSNRAEEYMQLGKGVLGDIEGFVLMSDGSAHSLVQKQQARFAGAVATMFRLGRLLPKAYMENLLRKDLLPAMLCKTIDDCSIALLLHSEYGKISPAMARHLGDIWQSLAQGTEVAEALRQAGIRKKYQPVYLEVLKKFNWIV